MMSINQRQFEQLTAMGISLWQHKVENNRTIDDLAKSQHICAINLQQLTQHPLFSDIILSLGLSLGEVSQQNDHLNVGLFNWYFTSNENAEIQWSEQQLMTPSLENIAQSPTLKKQLWQILSNNDV
jgi:DNA polymerase III psi subunit